MEIFRTLDPQRRRSLLILAGAAFLFWSSMASLLPTLPLYVQSAGGTNQEVGLVMGSFAIGLLLSRAWLGPLADHKGRKLVLLLGALVAELAPMGYLFTDSIPLLLVIRAFHGIGLAAFTTGYSALVTDLSPEGRRGELIGYMSLVQPIAVGLGPAIGGFVQAWAGYAPLFVMSSCFGLLALVCTYQVREPRWSQSIPLSASEVPIRQGYWQLLLHPRVRIPALVMLMMGVMFGTLSTFMPLFLQETGVNLNAGLFYSAAAVASFAIRLPTGRASDRYGRGPFIIGGLISYGLAMVMLWLADSREVFLVAALLEGAGAGVVMPTMVALISDRCKPQERGRIFSLAIGGFDLGIAIAGPILGLVVESVGYRYTFGLVAGLSGLAVLIFATQSSKNLSHSLKFAMGQSKDIYALN